MLPHQLSISAFTTAKYPDDPAPNEDAFAIDRWRGLIALSDGASESFDSATWARALVEQFVRNPHFDATWLQTACTRYSAAHDREALSWSAQAAYDRGSYATLIGFALHRDRCMVDVLGIGDSLAMLIDGSTLVDSFPYTDAAQFKCRPLLLCTAQSQNGRFITGDARRRFLRTWALSKLKQPTVLCMTDALGAWCLSAPSRRLPILLRIKKQDQFVRLVTRERATGMMRRDDTTLVRVS